MKTLQPEEGVRYNRGARRAFYFELVHLLFKVFFSGASFHAKGWLTTACTWDIAFGVVRFVRETRVDL